MQWRSLSVGVLLADLERFVAAPFHLFTFFLVGLLPQEGVGLVGRVLGDCGRGRVGVLGRGVAFDRRRGGRLDGGGGGEALSAPRTWADRASRQENRIAAVRVVSGFMVG